MWQRPDASKAGERGRCLSSALDTGCKVSFTSRVRNHIRQLRTERGLSQGELASAVNVSRQTINSIEQNRYTPSLPLAMALARFFGARVEEVFDADV
jgi:putative transcriptional regulator